LVVLKNGVHRNQPDRFSPFIEGGTMKTRLFVAGAAVLALLSASMLANAGGEDKAARVYRASHIVGLTVKNSENQTLGKIQDIVINVRTGEVVYVALARGGVAGIGSDLFAVHPDAFQLKADADNRPEYLTLNAREEDLKEAKGFNTNAWPRRPDPRWGKGGEGGKGGKEGLKGLFAPLTRLSALNGEAVCDPQGNRLGSAFDMTIDVANNRVVYVAVSHGGTAGVGGKLYSVDYNSLRYLSLDLDADPVFVLNASQQDFDRAKGWTSDGTWPSIADATFNMKSDDKDSDNDKD
jgi:sporulation protein YlmC with PRC-barrel domain